MKNYTKKYDELTKLMERLRSKSPEVMNGFNTLHEVTVKEEKLSSKIKELIALGIAITVRCDGCIAFHVHKAILTGATSEEIIETIGVAILMGGGPSVVYGCEALEAMEQFLALKNK